MKNLDDVLKKSLTPAESEEGPDFWLNQNIIHNSVFCRRPAGHDRRMGRIGQ